MRLSIFNQINNTLHFCFRTKCYIIRIISSSPTLYHTENLGLIKVIITPYFIMSTHSHHKARDQKQNYCLKETLSLWALGPPPPMSKRQFRCKSVGNVNDKFIERDFQYPFNINSLRKVFNKPKIRYLSLILDI